jgi:chromosome segregation ATPase
MPAITASATSETVSSGELSVNVQPVSQDAPITDLRAAFQTELAGVVDRLMAAASATTDAAVESARAAAESVLNAVLADLADKTRRNDTLTESFLQVEIQVEELRSQLQAECECRNAAEGKYEQEQSARARAEAANTEAEDMRQQVVAAYESRLRALHEELDGVRGELGGLRGQLASEASERARLVAALKTVQQACASAESAASVAAAPATDPAKAETTSENHDEPDTAAATPAANRSLKLVAPAQPPIDDSPELREYIKELFDRIDSMYWVDHKAHASADLVERLCANLRYAREAVLRRTDSDGGTGATLFERELTARLDLNGSTSLGRHLGIAAYELAEEAAPRAEAS